MGTTVHDPKLTEALRREGQSNRAALKAQTAEVSAVLGGVNQLLKETAGAHADSVTGLYDLKTETNGVRQAVGRASDKAQGEAMHTRAVMNDGFNTLHGDNVAQQQEMKKHYNDLLKMLGIDGVKIDPNDINLLAKSIAEAIETMKSIGQGNQPSNNTPPPPPPNFKPAVCGPTETNTDKALDVLKKTAIGQAHIANAPRSFLIPLMKIPYFLVGGGPEHPDDVKQLTALSNAQTHDWWMRRLENARDEVHRRALADANVYEDVREYIADMRREVQPTDDGYVAWHTAQIATMKKMMKYGVLADKLEEGTARHKAQIIEKLSQQHKTDLDSHGIRDQDWVNKKYANLLRGAEDLAQYQSIMDYMKKEVRAQRKASGGAMQATGKFPLAEGLPEGLRKKMMLLINRHDSMVQGLLKDRAEGKITTKQYAEEKKKLNAKLMDPASIVSDRTKSILDNIGLFMDEYTGAVDWPRLRGGIRGLENQLGIRFPPRKLSKAQIRKKYAMHPTMRRLLLQVAESPVLLAGVGLKRGCRYASSRVRFSGMKAQQASGAPQASATASPSARPPRKKKPSLKGVRMPGMAT